MSTTVKKFSPILLVFTHLLLFVSAVFAQELEIKIKIPAPEKPLARVELSFPKNPARNKLSFLQSYADAERLDLRIENLKVKNEKNQEILLANSSGGFFQTDANFSSISYDLRLEIPDDVLTAAHISWLTETHGLLMLNDVLPFFEEKYPAKVSFELPQNWKISASEKQFGEKTFLINDIQKAVFLVGTGWRENSVSVGESVIKFAAVGEWTFSTEQATKAASEIIGEYGKIFAVIPEKQINIFLLRFPREIGFERWRGETRGSNITLLSSPTAFESQAIQRLHEQLRHEIFHLWIPNKLFLAGDYAWFYEGFTQYAALKSGIELNRITFSNFLNTIEQAVNQNVGQKRTISLIEASKARWTGADSGVYAEGMLAAFLCDAALLRESGGKIDLFDVFRQIFQKHRLPANQTDGNAAVLEIMQSFDAVVPVIEKYIKSANKINLANDLWATGIEVVPASYGQKLQVKSKLQSREKDLLNKLGYNNWRKLLKNRK